MKTILVYLICFFLAVEMFAFSTADTVYAKVGKKAEIEIWFDIEPFIVYSSGTIKLYNPTMFFPESFRSHSGEIRSSNIERLNDSLFTYEVEHAGGEHRIYLVGETLAGNDSICDIDFLDVLTNGGDRPDERTVLITDARSTGLIYVRPDTIINVYPNPLKPGDELNINFILDDNRDVTFKVYSIDGREIMRTEKLQYIKGNHIIKIKTDFYLSSGNYLIYMDTNGFDDNSSFTIQK